MSEPRSMVFTPVADPPSYRVLVVPHAGAGAAACAELRAAADPSWLVAAVRLAGRESRSREPVGSLTDQVMTIVSAARSLPDGGPLVLLGCCSGAVLALEAARSLHELAPGLLAGLVVASRAAPHLPVPGLVELSGTIDTRIVDRLTELGGFAPAVLASPQLLEVVLPTVLGDFRAQEGYLAEAWALPIPLLTVAGEDDVDCSPEEMAGWCEYGNPVAHARIAGGHFLVMENPAGLLGALTQHLSLFEPQPAARRDQRNDDD